MHQIITKPNQNICCLPIIDIEEKFKSSTNENIEVADKDEITNFEQNDTSEVSENTENKTDITVKDKQSFIPKAFMCFSESENQSGIQNKIGVTFAQEAKNYRNATLRSENTFKQTYKDTYRQKLYVRNLDTHKNIPVISTGISGSRYIYDNNSLLDYCMKWCKSVYFGRVVLRAIHNTGTLLLIFPGRAMHFIQFLYGNAGTTESQRKFQSEISPVNVLEFHSFTSFSNWMKKQMALDS